MTRSHNPVPSVESLGTRLGKCWKADGHACSQLGCAVPVVAMTCSKAACTQILSVSVVLASVRPVGKLSRRGDYGTSLFDELRQERTEN